MRINTILNLKVSNEAHCFFFEHTQSKVAEAQHVTRVVSELFVNKAVNSALNNLPISLTSPQEK